MRFHAVAALAALLSLALASVNAQPPRVRFPSQYQALPPLVPVNPNLTPGQPGGYLGGAIQPFDPYAFPGSPSPFGGDPRGFGAVPSPGQSAWPGTPLPGFGVPGAAPQGFGVPPGTFPGAAVPPSLGAPYGQPIGPGAAGGSGALTPALPGGQPLPGGLGASPFDPSAGSAAALPGYGGASGPPYRRLFQDTGLRGTYLYGDSEDRDDLSLTQVEATTTAYFANFLGVPNGLRVTPGFSFYWTNGPAEPAVPARLYSAYVDAAIEPQFGPRFGAELSARVGVYSDFQSFTTDSLRFMGTGVGVYQFSDTMALKLGVAYIDRVKIKLLPAAGILWEPNRETRWDIFFPAPKLSNYWTTIGNRQVWWYLGGEYGGGSWTIEREADPSSGDEDRIDINDIRVYLGLEWWNLNRYYAFAEIGYVFEREVVFHSVATDSRTIDGTFMVRGGLSW